MEDKKIRLYKTLVIIGSLLSFIFFALSAFEENISREWRKYQTEFKELLTAKAKTDRQKAAAENFKLEVKQIILKDFNTVDRCVSCHNGIDNPNMADEALPHTAHSGTILKNHPVEKFGCTVCHGGQGRAVTQREAFAREKGVHWEFSVLPLEHIQASCGKCHLSVFENNKTIAGTEVLNRGRELFIENGCLSCHKVRNTGGTFSVDMTDQGNKNKHQYSFEGVEGKHNVPTWLKEHFEDPQKVAPGSQMMEFQLPKEDMDALITFTMGLFSAKLPVKYYSANTIWDMKSHRPGLGGEKAYKMFCAVCHGNNGEGKDYRIYEIGIPQLNNQDLLSAASDDMLEFTLRHGRTGRLMSPWAPVSSGLTDEEIGGIVKYLKGWKTKAPGFAEVQAAPADLKLGSTLFRSRCGTCHGLNGEGGLGLALNNQDLLSLASDKFLYDTISLGRTNTAMPSWSRLSAKELKSVMAYLRSWQRKPSVSLAADNVRVKGDVMNGQALFKSMCVGCHGTEGQGSVGPAILNPGFLKMASDSFIKESISRGRGDTAMIAWAMNREGMAGLTETEINNITAFMRSMENTRPTILHAGTSMGVPGNGQILYKQLCSGCHGKNGEGEHAPALNNQELLNAATNGFFEATIALGRSGTAMRSWAKGAQGYAELDGQDIMDIVSYIRTWQKSTIKIK